MEVINFVEWMQPRDHGAAGRTASTLGLVAAGVTLVFAVGQLAGGVSIVDLVVTMVAAAFIAATTFTARWVGATHPLVWALVPFLATAAIVSLDFFTSDATLSAQVFLLFPALFAAAELRRPGVLMVVGVVVFAECLVTGVMLPVDRAIIEAGYMSAAIITTAVLLTLAGERQERLIALLERQAAIDPLTGLVTRRVLDESARAALSGAASGAGTALILIDVDNFKGINDAFGHPGGDAVLVQLAELLTNGARSTDVVSRLGGDEIALLLPGCSVLALESRAEEILRRIRTGRFVAADGSAVSVSVSGGLAHAPTNASDLRSLYAAADRALYRAKHLGRNQIYAARSGVDEFDTGGETDIEFRESIVTDEVAVLSRRLAEM